MAGGCSSGLHLCVSDCARALIPGWILRFGFSAKMTSDFGAQFTSSIWDILCSLLNITCFRTTSFHPQSNGLVEWFHCSLKTSLCARLAGPDWFDHLLLVMLGLRSVPHDDSGFLATALYRDPLCLGSSWILMSYLRQCSRTGSNLLCEVLCCLLLIPGLRLLLRFLVL